MLFKKIFTAAVMAGAILSSPLTHAAAIISPVFVPGVNTLQDSDADRILRNGSVVTSGNFQVGDEFEAILRFDTVNSEAINSAVGTLDYGLWGYSKVSIAAINPGPVAGSINVDFAPSITGTVMSQLFEATSNTNYLSMGAGAAITAITGLTKVAEFGIGEADDFWQATIPSAINLLSQPLGNGQQSSGEFGLSILTNAGAMPIDKNGISGLDGNMHDIVGDASAFPLETGVNEDWIVSTNFNISFNNTVPEPSTLALMGFAVLLGARFQRRQG